MQNATPESPAAVAAEWEAWCGETAWSRGLRELEPLGAKVAWWCGYPRSASAIPLTFAIYLPDGTHYPGNYRLKDIQGAVALLKSAQAAA